MRSKPALALAVCVSLLTVCEVAAQDLGPNVRKIKDGIYVYVGNPRNSTDAARDSNAGIVITQEGVVLIDSGNNPTDSRAILDAVKKLTSKPVRYLILTEPHVDHYTGCVLFSPPAVVIVSEPPIESMKSREPDDPARIQTMMTASPEMRAALEGYRFVVPQLEYRQKMTLNVGERTFELLYLKNVHSEADTAIWLPKERVLFSAAGIVRDQFNILRSFVTIPDILAASKMLKGLNPEFVIPGHGVPGTVKIFEDTEQYYALLLDRVGKMVKDGKSLDQIKKELHMPEYDHWGSKDRIPTNIEAAYKVVKPSYAFR